MRLPIAGDIKTRTGAPADKDARIKNAYVETKGDQAVVRKRPIARGGVATGSGVAQGGIAVLVDGVQKVVTFWGDTPVTSTDGSGTTWSSGTPYSTGDHTTSGWQDYWAIDDNVGNNPINSPAHWSTNYIPAVPAVYATTRLYLSYNGNINMTFGNLTQGGMNSAPLSSSHSSATLASFIAAVTLDAETVTTTITGDYGGNVGGQPVTGTWSSPFDLIATYWDENPFFEIESSLQNVTSTSCTRLDLVPNGTIIGNMGNQGFNNAWQGRFSSHP